MNIPEDFKTRLKMFAKSKIKRLFLLMKKEKEEGHLWVMRVLS